MNPSTGGWITKLLKLLSQNHLFLNQSEVSFYYRLQESGFIYGNHKAVIVPLTDSVQLTDEEICKINLFTALYITHYKSNCNQSFLENIIEYYKGINGYRSSSFNIFPNRYSNTVIEKIIHRRVQIDDNILIKNFNYFVINALLYIDVLGYKKFIAKKSISINYIKKLEASIAKIVLDVLHSKINKTSYDESLIKLFESSMRFHDNTRTTQKEAIKNLKSDHEKWYLFDIACMSTWSEKIINKKEQQFLHSLGKKLQLSEKLISNSIISVNKFYEKNKDDVFLLSSQNIVKNFYRNSSKIIYKLVVRNKKRLKKELQQSKRLMALLSQSTNRTLTNKENEELQDQLFNIIKTIPSLAIFLLPGGAILLPIFIKLIPKLLPSTFDDNRVED